MFIVSNVVKRLLLAFVIATALLLSSASIHPNTASAYACGAVCKGIHRWDGGMDGAHAKISQVAMVSNDPGSGWVKAAVRVCSSGCAEQAEAGIQADTTYSRTSRYYYFSDITNANGFNSTLLAYVPTGELGYLMNVWLWNNSNSWSIDLTSTKTGGYHWAGYSTPNYMIGSRIYIGTSLYGTSGTTTPLIHYVDNAYKSSGNWIYQFRPNPSPGDYDSPSQPGIITCSWQTKPSVLNSAGGDWKASVP